MHPHNHVYLVDILALGETAFTVAGTGGETLRSILQSAPVPKVSFKALGDCLLYADFDIVLRGVQDIQLMERGSLPCTVSGMTFFRGLFSCAKWDAPISATEKQK